MPGVPSLLLSRPPLQPGESLPSWLVRLAAANGYNRHPGVLTSLLLGRERAPDRLHDRPGSPARAETYVRLAALTRMRCADLHAATIHRFAPTLTAPDSTALVLALPAGPNGPDSGAVPLLTIGSMQKRLRRESRAAFCPQCLAEAAYHRLVWTPMAAAACLCHRCLLIHGCPRCGAPTAVGDIVAARCRVCGTALATCASVSVAGDAFGLFAQRVVQAWLRGAPVPQDPAFPLPDLPANVAYRVVDGLRLLAQGAGPRWPYRHHSVPALRELPERSEAVGVAQGFWLSPAQGYVLYATALKALLHWPQGLHEFLDAYTARATGATGNDQRHRGGLAPALGVFYSDWAGRRWRHEAFGFLQAAFDQYLLDRYGRVPAVSQLSRYRRDATLAARFPYLNLSQASRCIGTSDAMLTRLLQRGQLTRYAAVTATAGPPRPRTLVSRTEVLAWRAAWRDHLTVAEAAAILGVSYWVVTHLIAGGLLPPPHQLAADPPRWCFNRAAITACHAHVAAQVTLLPTQTLAAGNEYVALGAAARVVHVLGLNAAALLVRVAEGHLPAYHAYHPATDPVRLGDLRFARADLTAYAAGVKATHDWLDRVETVQRLGISERALQRLVERGLLAPVPVHSHAYFFERATVDAFRADHLTSPQAAALLGIGPQAVQHWTRLGRLHPVSGPEIDGAHRYLFSRSSLAQWRADRLTFGEAAALLGVAKSTLAHWAGAGKIAPLTDMGGKQRWFGYQDIVRLREAPSLATQQPPARPARARPVSPPEGLWDHAETSHAGNRRRLHALPAQGIPPPLHG